MAWKVRAVTTAERARTEAQISAIDSALRLNVQNPARGFVRRGVEGRVTQDRVAQILRRNREERSLIIRS